MRFLSFQIADAFYGMPLEQVKEVIAFPDFTPIPDAPEHYLGIMSLREQIIPVLDLRIRFKLEPTLTHDTSVIICGFDSTTVGVVVDMIHNVISPADNSVMDVPGVAGEGRSSDLMSKVVQNDGKLTLTLDVKALINGSEKDMELFRSAQLNLKKAA